MPTRKASDDDNPYEPPESHGDVTAQNPAKTSAVEFGCGIVLFAVLAILAIISTAGVCLMLFGLTLG